MAVRHPNKRRALSPGEKLQICFSDPVYFIETFVWAIDKMSDGKLQSGITAN